MKILIMHQTITNHDAIGNDIELMYNILKKETECYVYAENPINNKIIYINEKELDKIICNVNTLIIYHHSVYWENGEKLLKKTKGKIIFRYHNITPEKFFEPYNNFHYTQCKKGREQTNRFIIEYPNAFWLSDSYFNTRDLGKVKQNNISVCAPFHKIDEWSKQKLDEKILKQLIESQYINLLFVGRIVPNKGHLFLLEVLRVFLLNYHNNIKLRIIGKFDLNLERYNHLIREKIRLYHIEKNVEFIGEINDAILASYYLGSDLFICTSEHEGFCVPLLEAQYFGLPVISLNSCAVPDTGGNGQVLLQKNARAFAAAIKIITERKEYYKYLQKSGKDNFSNNYSYSYLKNIFKEQIKKILED